MATDDVYILALESLLNGKTCVNTMAFRRKVAADPTTANFTTLAGVIANLLNDSQVDDLVYTEWRAQQVRGAGTTYSTTPPFVTSTVSFSGTYGGPIAGMLTGTPLPNNCAIACKVQTAQSGRRRQGRFFLPGIAENWADDNSVLNPTQLATLQTDLDAIIAAYGSGGSNTDWELGVWSSRIATNAKYVWTVNGPVLTSQGAVSPSTAFMAATAIQAQGFVASQRDRRPGI